MQRYLTAANREFQRQYRMLEHHYKTHKPIPAEPTKEETTEAMPTEEPPRRGIHIADGANSVEYSSDQIEPTAEEADPAGPTTLANAPSTLVLAPSPQYPEKA